MKNNKITKRIITILLSSLMCCSTLISLDLSDNNGGIIKTDISTVHAADYTVVKNKPYGSVKNDLSLAAGKLEMDKKYYSDNGKYYVVFQKDGNLVVYNNWNRSAVWNSGTANKGATHCIFQPHDGNLVIYNRNGAIWDTSTYGCGADELRLSNEGELYIYNKSANESVWSNKSSMSCGTYSSGKCISSPNRRYRAVLQRDGNFVVYRMHGGVNWNSKTANYTGASLEIKNNGSMYIGGKKVIGPTPYGGNRNHTLTLDDNGQLVMRDERGFQTWTTYPNSIEPAGNRYPLGYLAYNGAIYEIVDSVLDSWVLYDCIRTDRKGLSLNADSIQIVGTSDSNYFAFSAIGTLSTCLYNSADCYTIDIKLYHDQAQSRLYAMIVGFDSVTTRLFNTVSTLKAGNYTLHFSREHGYSGNQNFFFWRDSNGNIRMNLYEYPKDKTVDSKNIRVLFKMKEGHLKSYPNLVIPKGYDKVFKEALKRN